MHTCTLLSTWECTAYVEESSHVVEIDELLVTERSRAHCWVELVPTVVDGRKGAWGVSRFPSGSASSDYIALEVRTPCCRWYRWRILCCQLGFPSTLYDLQSMQGQSNYCLTPVVVWQQYTWKTRAGKASCPADVVASTCLSCWRFILNSGILQGIQVPICLSRCSYLGEASNWIQACEVKSVIQTYCVGFKWQKSLDIF